MKIVVELQEKQVAMLKVALMATQSSKEYERLCNLLEENNDKEVEINTELINNDNNVILGFGLLALAQLEKERTAE